MTEPTTDPTPEAFHAVFRAAGWSYTPPRDIFSHAEWNVWTAAARALDAFAQAAVEKERERAAMWIDEVGRHYQDDSPIGRSLRTWVDTIRSGEQL